MATLTKGYTFGATEQVTNTKLHNLVDLASIASIVNADISASANIAYTKLDNIPLIQDADGDTYAHTELNSDEDKIRFYTAGTQRGVLDSTALDLDVPIVVDTISENTPANGVVIDGCTIKDGQASSAITADSADDLSLASEAQGTIAYYDGGNWVVLGVGTVGQLLQTNGAGANPSWETIDTTPGDGTISQAKLKTTTGEVSHTVSAGTGSSYSIKTLPGGEYGFTCQGKYVLAAGSGGSGGKAAYLVGNSSWTVAGAVVPLPISTGLSTSYVSYVTLIVEAHSTRDTSCYVQQRYVTSSGIDNWIFFLTDKESNVISSWKAPDHPCYGNGNDYIDMPHPFVSYNEEDHNIVCIEKQNAKSLLNVGLQVINQNYKLSEETYAYTPIHIGWFENGEPVMVESLPEYIEVRKLELK